MPKVSKKKIEEFIRVDHAGERGAVKIYDCLLYTSPSPRDPKTSRMPSSA